MALSRQTMTTFGEPIRDVHADTLRELKEKIELYKRDGLDYSYMQSVVDRMEGRTAPKAKPAPVETAVETAVEAAAVEEPLENKADEPVVEKAVPKKSAPARAKPDSTE